jgi:hypothetical protein
LFHAGQFNRPPIDSTVESFRLMLAVGKIVKCGRKENHELFSLVLGGYGLFGIILDADLRVVPNEKYRTERLNVSCRRIKSGRCSASCKKKFRKTRPTC